MGNIYIDQNGIINPYIRYSVILATIVIGGYAIADGFDFTNTFLPTPITIPLHDEIYYLIFILYCLIGTFCAVRLQKISSELGHTTKDWVYLAFPILIGILLYNFTLVAIPHDYTLVVGKHASKQYVVSSLFHTGDRKFCPTITLQYVPPFTSKLCARILFERGLFKEGTIIEIYGKQSALGMIAESAKIIKP